MKPSTRSFYEAAVRAAVDHIYERLDEALDLAILAREAALSPLHFHRVFRGMIGETPLELHRRLRLERAAHTLAERDVPVTRIAFEAGYETHESFTRAFVAHFGFAPTSFRRFALDARAQHAPPPTCVLASRVGLHVVGDRNFILSQGDIVMKIDTTTLPEMRLATVRHVGPYPRISEAFARLGALAGPAGLIRPPETMMIALYHDDPDSVPADQLRSDAALTVPPGVPLPPGLAEASIAGGTYARAIHIGPYAGLPDAWAQLMGVWLPASGRTLAARPSFELYRNDPRTARPEELVTELHAPLE